MGKELDIPAACALQKMMDKFQLPEEEAVATASSFTKLPKIRIIVHLHEISSTENAFLPLCL